MQSNIFNILFLELQSINESYSSDIFHNLLFHYLRRCTSEISSAAVQIYRLPEEKLKCGYIFITQEKTMKRLSSVAIPVPFVFSSPPFPRGGRTSPPRRTSLTRRSETATRPFARPPCGKVLAPRYRERRRPCPRQRKVMHGLVVRRVMCHWLALKAECRG